VSGSLAPAACRRAISRLAVGLRDKRELVDREVLVMTVERVAARMLVRDAERSNGGRGPRSPTGR
jgi:hypothetical protein